MARERVLPPPAIVGDSTPALAASVSSTLHNWKSLFDSFVLPLAETPKTITSGDTTPTVKGAEYLEFANAAPTTVTNLDDGIKGQVVTLRLDANTTIAHNANIVLAQGANVVGTANDLLTLRKGSDDVWRQDSLAIDVLTQTEGDARYLRLSGGALTGPLLLPDGITSAPALAFASDPTTGLYTTGVGTFRFVAGGNLRFSGTGSGTNFFGAFTGDGGASFTEDLTLGHVAIGTRIRAGNYLDGTSAPLGEIWISNPFDSNAMHFVSRTKILFRVDSSSMGPLTALTLAASGDATFGYGVSITGTLGVTGASTLAGAVGVGTAAPAAVNFYSEVSSDANELARFRCVGGANNPLLRLFADESDNCIIVEQTGSAFGHIDWKIGGSVRGRMTNGGVFLWGTTQTGSTGDGDVVLANARGIRFVNDAGTDTVQVVGKRNTGWTAITGTASKAGYATGTATLQQVAETQKAIQDALIAHGLIGA